MSSISEDSEKVAAFQLDAASRLQATMERVARGIDELARASLEASERFEKIKKDGSSFNGRT